jgi:hypothetical protein
VIDDPVGYIAGGRKNQILFGALLDPGTLVMFGVADAGGTLHGLATIPEGVWELSLGL